MASKGVLPTIDGQNPLPSVFVLHLGPLVLFEKRSVHHGTCIFLFSVPTSMIVCMKCLFRLPAEFMRSVFVVYVFSNRASDTEVL